MHAIKHATQWQKYVSEIGARKVRACLSLKPETSESLFWWWRGVECGFQIMRTMSLQVCDVQTSRYVCWENEKIKVGADLSYLTTDLVRQQEPILIDFMQDLFNLIFERLLFYL